MADGVAVEKISWPDLVGKSYDEAESTIKAENPQLEVSKVSLGQPMTRDLRRDRVRIMVDLNDVVIKTPSVG